MDIVNLRTCFLIEMSFYQIVLSVSVLIVTVAVDDEEELLDLMSCLFIKKGCDDAKVAKLKMKVAAHYGR